MSSERNATQRRLSILVIAGLLGMLASAALAAEGRITPPKLPFEKYTLKNGLQVILHEDHSTPIVAVNMWYHVGSKNEKKGKTGFAHLFEHMMFQGSEHHDTDWFEALEPFGATDLNGTTDFDRTNYFQNVPPGALETTLYLEADRMGWLLPSMTQERLDNQKEVVKNERRQGVDNQPYGTVDERMYAVLYPSHHPYSWDVIGYMDDLSAASKADVEDFFKTYYSPNNCTMVIAGDIQPARVKELVERFFGAIPPGPPVARLEEWIPELSKPANLEMEDRVPLPRLYLAWHMPGNFEPGEADLNIAADVLANGKNSRLYKRLVYDLQIAQDVAAFTDNREISSLFRIQVTAKQGHTLDEIEPLVLEEIEGLKNKPPAAAEIERARTGILAGFTRGLERIGGFGGKSDRLGLYNTYLGDPGYLEQDFARYEAVTPASVQAAVRRWLHEGRVSMRVNPYPDVQAGPEVAGFDRTKMPSLGPEAGLALPQLQRTKLSNGLEVVLAESPKVPVVQMDLLVRGGFSSDRKEKPGVASFMSRMQDEGTKRRTALQISDEAQRLGAQIGTQAVLDNCRVRLNALKARLQPSLDLFADIVVNPAFPADELERQRKQVIGQIMQEKKQPVSTGLRIMPALLYGDDHPYGQPLTGSGTEASVNAMTRDDLATYHSTWFRPNNATLVVVGDIKMNEVVPMLEKAFAAWQPGSVPSITIPERPQPGRTTVYIIDKPGAAQSLVLTGHLMPPKNAPDDVEFQVLNTVLGGEFSSRVNMNLREEKGYTYGAYVFPIQARGQSTLLGFAQVRTDVTKESIVEMMKELRDIRGTRPVNADELKKAQDIRARSLPGEYETMNGIAAKVADLVTYDLPENYYAQYQSRVRACTTKGLTALANQRVQPDHVALVVVGDRQVIEPGIKSLNLGPIEYLDADGRPLGNGAASAKR
jgi:zinc protease